MHGVVPGRREAASPGTITTSLLGQITAPEYGFRAPAFGRSRNDPPRIANTPSSMRETSSMRAVSSIQHPRRCVVPGRREAASPGAITTSLSDQVTAQEYGFRAPAFGWPRNDRLRIGERAVIYAGNVIYARTVIYAARRPRWRRIATSIAGRGRHHHEIADAD
jgi:hypothetical protein